MFGKNEVVGKKYFENAGDKLFVTSVFMTLQGEGPYRGEPAVFVRLTKCNLSCYFCDTWFDSGDWLSYDQLIEKIHNAIMIAYPKGIPTWLINSNDKKIHCGLVITGGEPMLQKNLTTFLYKADETFNWVQIESNGTIMQDIPSTTTLVCSPKCSEKLGKPIKYLQPNEQVLQRASCLKFVMSADQNSPYSQIPQWALDWKESTGKQIFISPMNIYNKEPERNKTIKSNSNATTLEQRSIDDEVISFWTPGLLNMDQNQINHTYAAKYCLENGCIYNLQVHLYAGLA